MSETAIAHWRSVAREWSHFGSPLRPCDEDTRYMAQVIVGHFGDKPDINALLCGVTPEIARMSWPTGTFVTAVERSQEMIREVWPGDLHGTRKVVHGDWLEFETAGHAFDLVIGDGCFISMSYPEGYRALAARIASLLNINGLLIMRFFTQAEEKETPEQVFDQLLKGKIGSFHAFKWRLSMALQSDPRAGIQLHDIHAAWRRSGIDQQALIDLTGWSKEAVSTIDLYEKSKNSFTFAPLAEIVPLLQDYFSIRTIYTPTYELGERCPILVLSV